MDNFLSESAKTEISNKVVDILRAYHISNWHSEPYHQSQNPAEWRYRTIKSLTNAVMNRSGTPANWWLLCLIYLCYLLNHISCADLDGKIRLFALTWYDPDISIILLFTFYQPVFYATYDQIFPSESEERAGYWVGFGEHCGDAMTHKLINLKPRKLSIEVLLGPRNLLLPTIGLHHMEGSFYILSIKLPLDHQWDTQKVPHYDRRPLQSSSAQR